MAETLAHDNRSEPWVEVSASPDFSNWLAAQQISVAFTTYQSGKIFLLGRKPDGGLSVFERTFNRAMGLWSDGESLLLGTRYQIWRFENVLAPGVAHEGHDRLYLPRIGYTTGDLDAHDLCFDGDGRIVFVNTRFNCLATLHPRDSFLPLWLPPFIGKLVAEDRCHLNGLALEDGRPRWMTAVSRTDVVDGWRDRRRDGGVLIDIATNRIVVEGLSMPHSPRFHQGRLWLLNSGTGFLGSVDLAKGDFEPLTFCPGYLRGLAFVGPYAIVGLSKARHDKTFSGLALHENLAARSADARCGLLVIHLATGQTVHWVRIDGMVSELYDVAILPGASKPMALGFKTDEIQRLLTIPTESTPDSRK